MYFASILPSSLTLFLTSLLWPQSQRPIATNEAGALTFQLRHIHAINDRGQNVFADSSHSTQSFSKSPPTKYPIPTKLIKTHRPSSFEAFSNARFASSPNQSAPSTLSWGKHDIIGPRVEKRQTLVQLAKMTFDSFYDGPGHKEWYTLDSYWNQVCSDIHPHPPFSNHDTLRASRLDGNQTQMAFGDKYLYQKTTRQLSSPSRAHLLRGSLAATAPQNRRIN